MLTVLLSFPDGVVSIRKIRGESHLLDIAEFFGAESAIITKFDPEG